MTRGAQPKPHRARARKAPPQRSNAAPSPVRAVGVCQGMRRPLHAPQDRREPATLLRWAVSVGCVERSASTGRGRPQGAQPMIPRCQLCGGKLTPIRDAFGRVCGNCGASIRLPRRKEKRRGHVRPADALPTGAAPSHATRTLRPDEAVEHERGLINVVEVPGCVDQVALEKERVLIRVARVGDDARGATDRIAVEAKADRPARAADVPRYEHTIGVAFGSDAAAGLGNGGCYQHHGKQGEKRGADVHGPVSTAALTAAFHCRALVDGGRTVAESAPVMQAAQETP